MKYMVQLRMNGASGTQFLIDQWGDMDFFAALSLSQDVATKLEVGHYVEVLPQESSHAVLKIVK